VNEMTDLSERRLAALENRIPGALWLVLIFMSALTCLLVGFSLRRKALLVILVWPLMISIVLALNADLDSPRTGLIKIGQQSMERLR
jgi:TRAP-type C4-dicarboxylate transport system permease large subunit